MVPELTDSSMEQKWTQIQKDIQYEIKWHLLSVEKDGP